jgi:phage baseplate assembly protein W
MPRGYSPKLPLFTDNLDGKYALNKSLRDVVSQNLKNVILTLPGEKIMDPSFGVGLRKFIFEQNRGSVQGDIEAKIRQQVNKYMSYVVLNEVRFNDSVDDIEFNDYSIVVSVYYYITPLNIQDRLDLLAREN